MAYSNKDETSILGASEAELVGRTRRPGIVDLSDDQLRSLLDEVAGKEKALGTKIAGFRRALNGRGGQKPGAADAGIARKKQVYAKAVQRLKREMGRRDSFVTAKKAERRAAKSA
ncbi:hypothetical protein [Arenibaculum pallidiluteum]|uniref:hypothetical protein n=1 Tax=Arenibaculum pallidiluteum TaxID=2812559 RepID=UPI001A967A31|nr:hypothetical protein [Arenibaculum pallidiluteum]